MPRASSIARLCASACAADVSPLMRSARSTAAVAGRPWKSFSMPRCTNHSRAFSRTIVSPATENRK
ncbi:Uncharacterised protein [Mycobacterium tuberculosis]|uniref:Uncharacterized protein n=1 Tax=Mycobacterium tuberculosis TaxID=1773 RepID=A0A0U0RFF7_MYCTX|nr:Uncharacterised protein [Mycobacterium tuberculosis]